MIAHIKSHTCTALDVISCYCCCQSASHERFDTSECGYYRRYRAVHVIVPSDVDGLSVGSLFNVRLQQEWLTNVGTRMTTGTNRKVAPVGGQTDLGEMGGV